MSRLSTNVSCSEGINVRRHYETMHREKCNAYARKIREDQVMKLKSALCKQRSFLTNVSQSSEYAVKAIFAIIEMIAKSSRPSHEKGFLGYSLLLQELL